MVYGARNPLREVPALGEQTFRRTMHIDVGPSEGAKDRGALRISGAARDVRDSKTLAEATVVARFDRMRVLESLEVDPDVRWAHGMVGRRAGGGFRKSLAEILPGVEDREDSLVRQVLEDLPAGALISGYASLRLARRLGFPPGDLTPPAVLDRMTDLCSGWRGGGIAVESIAAGDGVPIQDTPPAPSLDGGIEGSWHEIPPLPHDWMRRRRLVDISAGDRVRSAQIWAMFRDTVGEAEGSELVLHEYSVSGRLEETPDGLRLMSLEADPRVLPFPECPAAAAEVGALAGTLLGDLPAVVPVALFGVASCTHLNDLLRSIGGVAGALGKD
jgi:hypothetical protein